MARAQHIGKIVFEGRRGTRRRAARPRAAFGEAYGHGVPVDFGLDVFRRVLSWPHAPTYVLAMERAGGGAGAGPPAHLRAAACRARAAGARRSRRPVPARRRGAVEVALARVGEKTLGIAPIGVDDDFVELGRRLDRGHPRSSTRSIARFDLRVEEHRVPRRADDRGARRA
jgi:hypothetical protein